MFNEHEWFRGTHPYSPCPLLIQVGMMVRAAGAGLSIAGRESLIHCWSWFHPSSSIVLLSALPLPGCWRCSCPARPRGRLTWPAGASCGCWRWFCWWCCGSWWPGPPLCARALSWVRPWSQRDSPRRDCSSACACWTDGTTWWPSVSVRFPFFSYVWSDIFTGQVRKFGVSLQCKELLGLELWSGLLEWGKRLS